MHAQRALPGEIQSPARLADARRPDPRLRPVASLQPQADKCVVCVEGPDSPTAQARGGLNPVNPVNPVKKSGAGQPAARKRAAYNILNSDS